MGSVDFTPETLIRALERVPAPEPLALMGSTVVVDLDADQPPGGAAGAVLHTGFPSVVVGHTRSAGPGDHPLARLCDVTVSSGGDDLDAIVRTVADHPLAATSLAVLLRHADTRSIDEGLHAESAVYSNLLAGPEFQDWLARRRPRTRGSEGHAIQVERTGDVLVITLDRPHVRNALNRRMRDELCDALLVAGADPSITRVELGGAGDAFCSGGDLDEFGSFADAASAHLVRLHLSVARAIASLSERVVATIHGACVGSGIELAAFAGRVVARPDVQIALPEVSMGLVPGAGGTVSLPRRIGRDRTAWLALTGRAIDATTAHAWGLVDEIDPSAPLETT